MPLATRIIINIFIHESEIRFLHFISILIRGRINTFLRRPGANIFMPPIVAYLFKSFFLSQTNTGLPTYIPRLGPPSEGAAE